MSREEIIAKFLEHPTYLTNGANFLAERWNADPEDIRAARKKVRLLQELDEENTEEKEFKRMFFDIETSYNIVKSWRTGYNLTIQPGDIVKERAIICICWKWENENEVHYLKWDEDQCDKAMLQEFAKELAKADEVIGHNGDRFDIKWLRTRCLFHRIPFNATIKSLDTLKKARSAFNFNSNKLDYIAKYLGVGGKTETGGMKLWDDIIFDKCKTAMHKMVTYCKNDVVILEDVFQVMQSYIHQNSHVGVYKGGKKHSCPSCGSDDIALLANPITKKGTIQRHIECTKCNTDYIISNTNWKKYLKE
jgi:uncharacterized protein YprB with RNaseH-like and TPR domain